MDISVIVPIYGVENYIEKSLRSLFSQTKTNGVEFILVNDCTKDRSMEVARRVIEDFPMINVTILDHEVNRGLAAARQTGLNRAIGTYVLHLDSDDWCESTMLEDLFASAIKNDSDIVCCDFYKSYDDTDIYTKQLFPNSKEELIRAVFRGELYGSVWNKFYKRKIYVENNIRWVEGLDMCEDLLINAKLLPFVEKISSVSKPYVHYRQREGSYVSTISPKSIDSMIGVIKEIERYYLNLGILDIYKESLLIQKNKLKLGMICSSTGIERKKYAALYPEAKRAVFKYRNRNICWYIALYLTYYGRFELIDILQSIAKRKR